MKKSRVVEDDGLVVTHFGGLHTYKDGIEALDELLQIKRGKKSIYEIVINHNDIRISINKSHTKMLMHKVGQVFSLFEYGGLAIVAESDLVFGLSRMLEKSIHNENIAVAVFRSEALARHWINEVKQLHDLKVV